MNTENKAPSTLEEEEELLRSIGVAQENAADTDDTETGTEIQNPYAAAYETALEKLANREPFEYDVNGDAVYQQYKEKAQRSAALGMKDTVAQIAAMNGGYGNSYAQTAGQQVYNSTMQEVDDMIPELYDIALERYNRETDDLQATADAYGDAYGQWEELRAEAEKGESGEKGENETIPDVVEPEGLSASELSKIYESLQDMAEAASITGDYKSIEAYLNILNVSDEVRAELVKAYIPETWLNEKYG